MMRHPHRRPALPLRAALAEAAAELACDDVAIAVRTCRRCGCTDDQACPGGCWWVSEDLCSACAYPKANDA